MAEDKKYPTSSTSASVDSFDIHTVQKTMSMLNRQRFSVFAGMPVVEDVTGLFTHPNGYVIVMGCKMFAEMQRHLGAVREE